MLERVPIEPNNFSNDERLLAEGLTIAKGWDEELAASLVERSREEAIMLATPRDTFERFADTQTAMDWYHTRPKVIYSLSRAAELAGIIWFSKQSFDGADWTFAVRLYRSARKKGLAKPFARAAHFDHEIVGGYTGDTWLETDVDNQPAQRLFSQLRYQPVGALDLTQHRIRMMRRGIATSLEDSIRWLK
jgi:ribosomal protein S18 acetylase RimI-like enzyme